MRLLWLCILLLLPLHSFAQEEDSSSEQDQGAKAAAILEQWLKTEPLPPKGFPRRWLVLQEQGGAYGSPMPLGFDRPFFEGYGWLEADEGHAVRLYFQVNPKMRQVKLGEPEMLARLETFLDLSLSAGIIMKNADSSWSLYASTSDGLKEIARPEKGPDNLRQEGLVRWLIQQFGYDAIVAGSKGDFLILAKLKPVRVGAQGLIMKGTSSSILIKDSKDVGALLRVVHETEDYLMAKVLLSKSGRSKAPVGSKVQFSSP